MAEGTCVHLDVALECSGDTIRGVIDDHTGGAVKFSGWLELMSAFDTVCARAGKRPAGSTSSSRAGAARYGVGDEVGLDRQPIDE